jgi:hypothetical protein
MSGTPQLLAALYILNIVMSPLLAIFTPLYLTRYFKLSWVNLLVIPVAVALPVTMLTTLSGPYVFLPDGLFNPYFQYAMFVDNVHTLLSSLSIIWLVKFLCQNPEARQFMARVVHAGVKVRPERMRLAARLFLVLFVISFVLLAQPTYGLVNWILSPRTGYQSYRTGAGQWYAFAITFLSVSIVLATTYARSTNDILKQAPVYLFGAYLFGSKGFIISFAAYLAIILALRQYRYFKPFAIILLTVSVVLLVHNFVDALGGVGLEDIAAYSDYFVNAAKYYEGYLNGFIPLYHGEIGASNIWGLVPRALYPDKPYVYGVIKIAELFYPGAAENTSTPAFATVDYFADFGWLGVVTSGLVSASNLMYAALYALVLPRLKMLNIGNRIEHKTVLSYAFLLLVGPAFLVFFVFPLNTVLLVIIAASTDLMNRLRIVPRADTSLPMASLE